jgi:hypothetical protein
MSGITWLLLDGLQLQFYSRAMPVRIAGWRIAGRHIDSARPGRLNTKRHDERSQLPASPQKSWRKALTPDNP